VVKRGIIVSSGRDEYPASGYRLEIDGRQYEMGLIEEMIGRENLQIGDEVEVSCRVVSRIVTERKRVPNTPPGRPEHLPECGTKYRGCAPDCPALAWDEAHEEE
jgi:hypothetical protein